LGGLLPTLLEMGFEQELGFTLDLSGLNADVSALRLDERLFGETAGTYIVAYRPEHAEALRERCAGLVQFIPIGRTIVSFELQLEQQPAIALQPLKQSWSETLAVL